MYIAPQSTIKILRNVPLDNSYTNSLYFASISAQTNYFLSMVKPDTSLGNLGSFSFTLENQSYQRYAKGSLRIEIPSDLLYDCNYLMFRNDAFGNKWFYAFINTVTYVNNITSQVDYEIDILQTWFFDWERPTCYIIREHVTNDGIGANLLPEPINSDIYEMVLKSKVVLGHRMLLVVGTEPIPDGQESHLLGGIYTNLFYRVFDLTATAPSAIAEIIRSYVATEGNAIVSITEYPAFIDDPANPSQTSQSVAMSTNLSGYVPKNNKLLCYPYNFLRIFNNLGASHDYRFEFFESSANCNFVIKGTAFPKTTCMLYPTAYDGIAENTTESITYGSFSESPISTNVFDQWYAINKNQYNTALMNDGINAIVGVLGGGMMGGVNALASIGTTMVGAELNYQRREAQLKDLKASPAVLTTQSSNDTLNYVAGLIGYQIMQVSVKPEVAKSIDDYFTRYGYTVETIKTLSLNNRQNFTYIETGNIHISGTLPADSARGIENIFNKGVTFWSNPANVGNYSVTNGPI